MFGFLKRKSQLFVVDSRSKDLQSFTRQLENATDFEVATVLLSAAQAKYILEKECIWDLDTPVLVVTADPLAVMTVARMIRDCQSRKTQVSIMLSSGYQVWLHVLRAAETLEIRNDARILLKQLARGVDHLDAVGDCLLDMGILFELRDSREIPYLKISPTE